MTLGKLWAFLAVALPVLAGLIGGLSSVDLAYHLRAGEEILATGAIPSSDTYTFTVAGSPWLDQQWLAQAVLALGYRVGGWTGLVVLHAAMLGAISGSVFLAARGRGADERVASILALAAFSVAAVALGLRPQLFGVLAFALVLLLLGERHRHPRLAWLVPLVVVLWANLHGSFFLAPIAVGAAWLDDEIGRRPARRQTLALVVATVLATAVTPFGPQVWAYALGLTSNRLVTDRVTEWQPTSPRDLPGIAFYVSALAFAALLARRGRAVSWPDLLWVGTLFVLGAYAIRGVAWWPIGAAIVAATMLRPATKADDDPTAVRSGARLGRRSPLNAILAAGVIVACVVALPVWRPVDPVVGPAAVVGQAPPGITAALREMAGPGDRLFHPQPWGSWFEFAVPELPTFVDSRIELFPVEVWDDYDAVVGLREGWLDVLDRWGVTFVVVPEGDAEKLRDRLVEEGWAERYADEDGWILARPAG